MIALQELLDMICTEAVEASAAIVRRMTDIEEWQLHDFGRSAALAFRTRELRRMQNIGTRAKRRARGRLVQNMVRVYENTVIETWRRKCSVRKEGQP